MKRIRSTAACVAASAVLAAQSPESFAPAAESLPPQSLSIGVVPIHTAPDDPLGGPYGIWAATDTYKVSMAYLEGYKANGQLTVSGPDALAKAKICAKALWGRLKRDGVTFEETRTEYLGVNSSHEGIVEETADAPEVVLRVGVKDPDRAKVNHFGREIAPLVTSGPPGVTGFAGGRLLLRY